MAIAISFQDSIHTHTILVGFVLLDIYFLCNVLCIMV